MKTDEKIMKHNDPYVDEICELFKDNQRILFTAGTGVGKSYVGRKVIERLYSNDPVLIVVPNNSLKLQWMKYLKGYDNIEIQTSAYIMNMVTNRSYQYYKLVVLDECHQTMGAPTWGKCALDLVDTLDCDVLGLTATELRYRDGVNVEVFFNKHVIGIPLNEAIDRGIVNTFTYISCYFDAEKDIDAIRAYAKSKYTKNDPEYCKLDKRLCIEENKYKIENIIKSNMPDDQRKIIVFYKDYNDLDECKEIMRNIYPDADYYEVSYEHNKSQNEESIKKFENSDAKIAIIYSVNILGQGLHINAVDTVVMLRRTKSQQIFFQQLGRLISLIFSKDKENVLFDIMANAHSVEPVCLDDYSNLRMVGSVEKEVKFSDKVVSKDYRKECAEMLKEVYNRLNDRGKIDDMCKELGVSYKSFSRTRRKYNFSIEEVFKYYKREMPNPNGYYYVSSTKLKEKGAKEKEICKAAGVGYDEFLNARRIYKFTTDETINYLKGMIPNPKGHFYKNYDIRKRTAKMIKEFCEENDFDVTTVYYAFNKYKFTIEETFGYLSGKIPNPKGKYYRDSRKDEMVRKFCKEINIDVGTFSSAKSKNHFTIEETMDYISGKIPGKNGSYYNTKCKNDVKTIKAFCKEHGILYQSFISVKKRNGFTEKETFDYLSGKIPGKNGFYFGEKFNDHIKEKAIKEFGITSKNFSSVKNQNRFSSEETYRYLKGEIPNHNGHYYKSNKKKSPSVE